MLYWHQAEAITRSLITVTISEVTRAIACHVKNLASYFNVYPPSPLQPAPVWLWGSSQPGLMFLWGILLVTDHWKDWSKNGSFIWTKVEINHSSFARGVGETKNSQDHIRSPPTPLPAAFHTHLRPSMLLTRDWPWKENWTQKGNRKGILHHTSQPGFFLRHAWTYLTLMSGDPPLSKLTKPISLAPAP